MANKNVILSIYNKLKSFFKKKTSEYEERLSSESGYPYNVIPKGYPNKISEKKLSETIEKILRHLEENANVYGVVSQDTAFINLGLNELNNRNSRKQSQIAFWISILSLFIAVMSIFYTWAQLKVGLNQIELERDSFQLQNAIWLNQKMRDERIENRDLQWRKEDIEGKLRSE